MRKQRAAEEGGARLGVGRARNTMDWETIDETLCGGGGRYNVICAAWDQVGRGIRVFHGLSRELRGLGHWLCAGGVRINRTLIRSNSHRSA